MVELFPNVPAALRAAGGSVVNLGKTIRILELHGEGLSISAIAPTRKDRKTVRKWKFTPTLLGKFWATLTHRSLNVG